MLSFLSSCTGFQSCNCGFTIVVTRSHIANDRLSTLIDVDMLDADVLISPMTETTKGLHLN